MARKRYTAEEILSERPAFEDASRWTPATLNIIGMHVGLVLESSGLIREWQARDASRVRTDGPRPRDAAMRHGGG